MLRLSIFLALLRAFSLRFSYWATDSAGSSFFPSRSFSFLPSNSFTSLPFSSPVKSGYINLVSGTSFLFRMSATPWFMGVTTTLSAEPGPVIPPTDLWTQQKHAETMWQTLRWRYEWKKVTCQDMSSKQLDCSRNKSEGSWASQHITENKYQTTCQVSMANTCQVNCQVSCQKTWNCQSACQMRMSVSIRA